MNVLVTRSENPGYKAILVDMEGDSYRLRETLKENGTSFEEIAK